MNNFRKITFNLFLVLIALTFFSCGEKGKSEKNTGTVAPRVKKQSEKGPVQTTVYADTDEISLAGIVEYTLEVKSEKGYTAELPDFNQAMFGGLIVKDRITKPKEYPDTMTTIISEKYILEPLVSGNYTISPITINFTEEKDTKVYSLETKSIEIKVSSLLDTDGQIPVFRDSIEPMTLKRDYKKIFKIAGIALVSILALAIAIILYLKKKKKIVFIKTPKKPAHITAYEKLQGLVELQLIEKGEYKAFYYSISFIFREYLENRFNLKAPEQTTEEFISDIYSRSIFEKESQSILKEFMEFSDLVKYAKHKPENSDIQKSFNIVKNFIEKTKEGK